MKDEDSDIKALQEKLRDAEAEIENLRKELMDTNTGVIALYNELNDINEQMQQKNEELNNTLSELKEIQNKLVQSEKIAVMGSVVVTYNHQINNPLMIILGNVQLILMTEKNLTESVRRRLELIEKECWRISAVTSKIKDYEKLIPVQYLNTMFDLNLDNISKRSP